MANRILTWHSSEKMRSGDRIGPTYYINADYQPVAVRMYAQTAPSLWDVEVNIFVDDVSIFSDRASSLLNASTVKGATLVVGATKTTAILPLGDNAEIDAEDLIGNPIEEGSWVYCELVEDGGCENLSVHLELTGVNEEDEESED